jgi:pimeloyl-ACP methyl ester carboxylesterase
MRYLTKGIPIIIFLMFAFIACSSDNDRDAEAELGTVTTEQQESAMIPSSTNQQTVRSADGTRIAYTKVGSGPVPLVIVHGALNTSQQWMPVAEKLSELSDQYTCYVVDRWGRGGSDGRPEYSLEHEINDIIEVLKEAGPDAYLLGHSSGAIYALETALSAPVAGLVLYEPPLHGWVEAEPIHVRIQSEAEEERYGEALSIFFAEILEVPEEELSQLRTTPAWDAMVGLAPPTVREWEALRRDILEVDRYRDISVPTLLLEGTETADHHSSATEALQRTLPDVRTALLEGEGHTANLTSPEMVAQEVIEFVHN